VSLPFGVISNCKNRGGHGKADLPFIRFEVIETRMRNSSEEAVGRPTLLLLRKVLLEGSPERVDLRVDQGERFSSLSVGHTL